MSDTVLTSLGILSGIITFFASIPYLRDIIAGKTKPERATWLIWSVLNFIFIATNIAEGATVSVIFTAVGTVFAILFLAFAIKMKVGKFVLRDKISLLAAGFGLLLWYLTDNPVTALVIAICVDASGGWLTAYKAYYEPWSETLSYWLWYILVTVLAAISVGELDPVLLAFPVYAFIYITTVSVIIIMRRRTIEAPPEFRAAR